MQVECLNCGGTRDFLPRAGHAVDPSDCPRCGYTGWAPVFALTEPVRRALREQPPERRRGSLRVAA